MTDLPENNNQTEEGVGSPQKTCWVKFSETKLVEVEKKILQVLKSTYKGWFVPIGSVVGTEDKIWTIALNQKSTNVPLVLLHGFAAGVGFWCLNLDELSKDRPVYALDLLGFGRSSRPNFNSDGLEAEQEMIRSIEAWRKSINLEQFVLLGHSFGGYLASSYALSYPERVKHLILVDPWGFTSKPTNFNPPLWIKALAIPLTKFNPLATVRAMGPMGPWLIKKVRSDISEKYSEKLEDKSIIGEYIYQCNSQKPTGETAFHNMIKDYSFPKNPMVERIHNLKEGLPVTLIYGKESWMDRSSGPIIKDQRSNSYVNLEVVPSAGHHIHADQPHIFNTIVVGACNYADKHPIATSEDDENDNKSNDNTTSNIEITEEAFCA